jgi:hypothetical protein
MGAVLVRVMCGVLVVLATASVARAANTTPMGDQLVGNCGETGHGAGCSDAGCQACVCADRPQCCTVDRTVECLNEAAFCAAECFAVVGNCGDPRPEPGCNDPICEACVCAYNFIIDLGPCCENAWTNACAQFADGILFGDEQCVEECLLVNRADPAPLLPWLGVAVVLAVMAGIGGLRLRRARA